jgi:hypothetical protein
MRTPSCLYVASPNFLVFYAVRVISKESRRPVLSKTYCFFFHITTPVKCFIHMRAEFFVLFSPSLLILTLSSFLPYSFFYFLVPSFFLHLRRCQSFRCYSVEWWGTWWKMRLKGSGSGLFEILSQYLPEGNKENHKGIDQNKWCLDWDSNCAPSEHHSRSLPLHHPVRSLLLP